MTGQPHQPTDSGENVSPAEGAGAAPVYPPYPHAQPVQPAYGQAPQYPPAAFPQQAYPQPGYVQPGYPQPGYPQPGSPQAMNPYPGQGYGYTYAPPPPPAVAPVENPVAYHRLFRTNPTYRWWRPLVAAVLMGVFTVVASIALSIVYMVVAVAAGRFTLEQMMSIDFVDDLMAEMTDVSNPLSLMYLLSSLAILLPLVALSLLCAGIRPTGMVHSVTFRLRWVWMLRCLVPSIAITAVSIGISYVPAIWEGNPFVAPSVDVGTYVLLVLIILIMTPLQAAAEEYIFRGVLLQVVGAWVRWAPLTILITTVMFTVGHTQYEIWGMLTVAVMGLGFAVVTLRTGGLEAAIALHAINNIVSFLMLSSGIMGTTEMSSEGSNWMAPVIQLVLAAGYILWIDVLAKRHGIARVRDLTAPSENAPTGNAPTGNAPAGVSVGGIS